MSWSLNEVEGLARKAARGSGLSWGLAEEAGKAVRWLTAVGLPGPETLSGLLTQNDGLSYEMLCPLEAEGTWNAQAGHLCPLISGAVVCDHAAEISAERGIELGATSFPMLLLPFVAGAAEMAGRCLEVSWPGTKAVLTADGRLGFTERETASTDRVASVSIHAVKVEPNTSLPETGRVEIPADTAKTLGMFAHRTYAPDTPESRLAGAGAGLTDND